MKTYLIIVFGVLLLMGCQKYDDTAAAANLQVPPYTETGANTFGCLLNGAPWANFGATLIGQEFGGSSIDTNKVMSGIDFIAPDSVFVVAGTLGIYKKGVVQRLERMSFIIVKRGSLKGANQLSGNNSAFEFTDTHLNRYSSLAGNPFTVTINKDTVIRPFNHIVSGMFKGMIYNYNKTDSLRIAGGVFDVTVGGIE